MAKVTEKLETIATSILDELEKKPIRTIIVAILAVYLIGKVIKAVR